MNVIPLEITQGDDFYLELGFIDAEGAAIDISDWAIRVDFKLNFNDTVPLFSLTEDDAGIARLIDASAVSIAFDASAITVIDISPIRRNGDLVPSRTIYADVKLTPPKGTVLIQGHGARTLIPLKVYVGMTA